MKREINLDLGKKIDDIFGSNTERMSSGLVVEAALEEFDLKEEELNSVLEFADLLSDFQVISQDTRSHAALVGLAAGLLIGKTLTEWKGEQK